MAVILWITFGAALGMALTIGALGYAATDPDVPDLDWNWVKRAKAVRRT